jgi:hypothetical protein
MVDDRLLRRKVANDLRTELAQLDTVMKDHAGFRKHYGARMDRHLYRAEASFMTDFYLCTEAIFTSIADGLDGGVPRGRNWRKRQLASMAVGRPGVRPAVISPELLAALTPFLVFSHAIPQAYGSSFDQGKLTALEKNFQPTQRRFSAEMEAFCTFLEGGKGAP